MKKYFQVQSFVLLAGTIFAWYTVVADYVRFFDIEGTIFRIKDCAVPNPVTTPCFWGAWAFLVALIWSLYILRKAKERQKNQKHLLWLLIAGTVFAWSNMTYELVKFYSNQGEPTIGCSGYLVTNPFNTPCFYGSVLFLLSLVAGVVAYRALKSLAKRKSDQYPLS